MSFSLAIFSHASPMVMPVEYSAIASGTGAKSRGRKRLIHFSPDTPQGRTIADWCRTYRLEPQALIEVRAGQAACALAASGASVAVVDSLTAQAWGTDKLAFRPVTDSLAYEICAVTPHNLPQSMLLAAFTALVAQDVA